jgi:hypothetical protein
MLEINAGAFLGAVTEMRTLIVMTTMIPDKANRVGDDDRNSILSGHIEKLILEIERLGARSAIASASRLKAKLADPSVALTYVDVHATLLDIESRFADHLNDIKLFVLNQNESSLFGSVDAL